MNKESGRLRASGAERFLARAHRDLKEAYAGLQMHARRVNPLTQRDRNRIRSEKAHAESLMYELAQSSDRRFDGRVVVDAMWFNPNYWWRYSLLSAAIGLAHGDTGVVIGRHRSRESRETAKNLGIPVLGTFKATAGDTHDARAHARRLLAQTERPADILEWDLPFGYPGSWVYDGILKRGRSATVDLADPLIEDHVAEALQSLEEAKRLIESRGQVDLLLLSHAWEYSYSALAFVAGTLGVPTLVLSGGFGLPRFWRMSFSDGLFDWCDRLSVEEIDALPPAQSKNLVNTGQRYLEARMSGQIDDLGSRYAYINADQRVDRSLIASRFGWDPDKPIVAVYASNWFDYPHVYGMQNFLDYHDWINTTLVAARSNTDVNWLFKPHPVDQWYGGQTLKDVLDEKDAPHIALAPQGLFGRDIIDAVDAVVTCTGTAAIEYASLGKPSLIADRGWYHDCGIALWPQSREEYCRYLAEPWWDHVDRSASQRRAQLFACWTFCRPDWQPEFATEDDSLIFDLYRGYPDLIRKNPEALRREIGTLSAWFDSGSSHYHSFKMMQADGYAF